MRLKGEIMDDSRDFGLRTERMELPSSKIGKAAGGVCAGPCIHLTYMERIWWCAGKCLTVGFEEGEGLPNLQLLLISMV